MISFDLEWGGGKVCVEYNEDHGELEYTVELYTSAGMKDITRDLSRMQDEIIRDAIWSQHD